MKILPHRPQTFRADHPHNSSHLARLNELLRAGEGMVDSDQLEMSFDRAGRAFANEQKFPFVVEVPVAANGLDIELNGRIIGFHKTRSTPPRHGRTIWRNEQRYYRWCFSDLETARAFVEQFGGAFHKTTGT